MKFNFFKKKEVEVQKSIQYMPVSVDDVFSSNSNEYSKLIEKSLLSEDEKQERIKLVKKAQQVFDETSITILPQFQIMADFFANVVSVASNINFIVNTISGVDFFIDDEDETFEKIKKDFNFDFLIRKLALQLEVYGTLLVRNELVGKKPLISAIPLDEVLLFYGSRKEQTLTKINWYSREFSESVWLENSEKNKTFFTDRIADLDSSVFGFPVLRSVLTIVDGKLKDDENYQLFLQNGSFPGILVFVPQDEIALKNEMDSFLRQLRDSKSRFKSSVIQNALADDGKPKVAFQSIKQQMENRLTIEEKREIDGQIQDVLGIPRGIIGFNNKTGGLNSTEYEAKMNLFFSTAILPRLKFLVSFLNREIMPIFAKFYGKEKLELSFNLPKVELGSEMRKSYLEGFKSKVLTLDEVRKMGFGLEEMKEETEQDENFEETEEKKDTKNFEENEKEDENLLEKSLKEINLENKKEIKDLLKSVDYSTSQVEKYLESKKAKDFEKKIEESLLKQFKTFTIKKTKEEEESLARKTEIEEIDWKEMLVYFLFFGNLGIKDAERQLGSVLSSETKQRIDEQIKIFIENRILALEGKNFISNDGILNPSVPSIYATTKKEIAEIVLSEIEEAEKERKFLELAKNRAELIKNTEMSKIFNVGLFLTATKIGATQKEWLKTISIDPREDHLFQVGVQVPMTATFPNGNFWSNEEFNCKCGIKVIY